MLFLETYENMVRIVRSMYEFNREYNERNSIHHPFVSLREVVVLSRKEERRTSTPRVFCLQLPRLPGHTNLKKSTSVTIFSRDVLDPLSLFCRRRSRYKQVLRRIKVQGSLCSFKICFNKSTQQSQQFIPTT